jgi:sugar O-acyltransferase (sialic acid O-acetyltransferase NeuD family)
MTPDVHAEEAFLRAIAGHGPLPGGGNLVALGIGDNRARLAASRRLSPEVSPPLVHPTALVPTGNVAIGPGSVVLPRVVVHPQTRIGQACILNTGAIVEHDCTLADGVHISPGAILTGGVDVGELAWIGAGAVVLPGRRIAAGAIVGAGAVVTRDVGPGVTVVGNPARPTTGRT